MPSEDPRQRLAYDRTHLANERTFAAWIRTGLSVAAVGLAVAHFLPLSAPEAPRTMLLGVLFVLAGVGMIAFGAWRFSRVSRDLAEAGSPSTPLEPRVIYLLTGLTAVLLLAVVLIL